MQRRGRSIVVALLLLTWFLAHAWRGLTVYFQGDDAMNLYFAWLLPPWKILLANLTPFTAVYRPVGTAFYRVMFALAGWHPLPYRAVVYCLLLVNIGLLYQVTQILTGSAEIGVLAALLGSYHPRLMDIYLSGGTVYDVLCYTLVFCALWLYLKQHRWLFLICYIMALNAKEMAAGIPLILLAYEWIYRRRLGSLPAWLAVAITAVAFVVKRASPSFAKVGDYAIHFTLHQFFATTRPLVAEVFYLSGGALNNTKTIAIFVLVWAIALVTRRKALLFAAAFVTLAPLPINFIPYRGFFVMYFPLAGWAMYIATAAVEGRDWLLQRLWRRPALIPGSWEPERVGLFLFVAYALFNLQLHDVRSFDFVDPSQANLRELTTDLRDHPPVPKGGRVLLLNDPFPRDVYDPVFVLRMSFDDPELLVDRVAPSPAPPYDLVLDFDGRRYQVRKEGLSPH